MRRSLAVAFFLLVFAAACCRAAPLVWFCPNDSKLIGSQDYDAQWPKARGHVSVFKFYYQGIRDPPIAELRAKFTWLKAHHIAVAVEWPAMAWTENGAGYQTEGFNPANTSQALARKIQSAGGTLDYVAMDEPLFYGHYDSGPHAAHWPVAAVAANVAANLRQVWAVFPQCRVGDIEPVDAMPIGDYLPTTALWVGAFQAATGHPLAFLHDDILWRNGWRESLPKVSALLSARKIPLGVIFNATGGDGPSAHWMESAEVNIQSFNAAGVPKPDHVIFQTWYPLPSAVLPETSPPSFSFLVGYYFGPSARQSPPVPFLRLYNARLSRHRYTTDAREAASLVSHGWAQEPPVGGLYKRADGANGPTPLYQLSGADGDQCLTTDRRERAALLASGHRDGGIVGYVFGAADPAGQPLYHAGCALYPDFYTCNLAEYDGLTAPTWRRYGAVCAMP